MAAATSYSSEDPITISAASGTLLTLNSTTYSTNILFSINAANILSISGGGLSIPASTGIVIPSGAPGTITDKLYSLTNGVNNALYFNGSAVGFSRLPVADASFVINTTASCIVPYTSITAPRTLTLPSANIAGQIIWIVDSSGSVTTTNTITVTRAGIDTIEGIGTTWILASPYISVCLESNGAGKWAVLTYEELPIILADANITVTNREDVIIIITSITAARTIALPAAITLGQRVTILDISGAVSTTNTITINRAGLDTINNALTSYVLNVAYGYIECVANGTTKWTIVQEVLIASGGSLATSGAFPITLTGTAATNSTLPAGTHTLAGLDVAQSWSAVQTFSILPVMTQGITLTSYAGGTTAGQLWYDSTQLGLAAYVNGIKSYLSGVLFVSKTSNSVTLASTSTYYSGITNQTLIGTNTLPANFLIVGKAIKLKIMGLLTIVSSASVVNFRVILGGGTNSLTATGSLATGTYNVIVEVNAVCLTTGTSATWGGMCVVTYQGTATTSANMVSQSTLSTINSTITNAVDFSVNAATGTTSTWLTKFAVLEFNG